MADYHEAVFRWPQTDCETVIVTGTFDQWSSSVRLTKGDTAFEGTAKIPWGEKVDYKFIVDGHWTVHQDHPTEPDAAGNINNVYIAPPKPGQPPVSTPAAIQPTLGTTEPVNGSAVTPVEKLSQLAQDASASLVAAIPASVPAAFESAKNAVVEMTNGKTDSAPIVVPSNIDATNSIAGQEDTTSTVVNGDSGLEASTLWSIDGIDSVKTDKILVETSEPDAVIPVKSALPVEPAPQVELAPVAEPTPVVAPEATTVESVLTTEPTPPTTIESAPVAEPAPIVAAEATTLEPALTTAIPPTTVESVPIIEPTTTTTETILTTEPTPAASEPVSVAPDLPIPIVPVNAPENNTVSPVSTTASPPFASEPSPISPTKELPSETLVASPPSEEPSTHILMSPEVAVASVIPAPEPVPVPTPESASEPAAEPVSEPTAEPVSEPTAEPVLVSATEPVSVPAVEPASTPAAASSEPAPTATEPAAPKEAAVVAEPTPATAPLEVITESKVLNGTPKKAVSISPTATTPSAPSTLGKSDKQAFPSSGTPSTNNSPPSSKFNTASSRKKRTSIFGKLKNIFTTDKEEKSK